MTLDQAFQDFIRLKRLSGLTEKSLESYMQHIGVMIKYLGHDLDLNLLSRVQVESYIEHLLGRNISRATLSTYLRDSKIFLVWLEKRYHIDVAAPEISVPKSPKTSPRIYSDDDVRMIFQSVIAEKDWIIFRNMAMIALMYDSGLRQSEVVRLSKGDVDWEGCMLKIYGKGNKERRVPLGIQSKKLMQRYLNLCPYSSEQVFVGRRGEVFTNNALKLLVSKLARQLPFQFSCHKLRHNFATNYCLDQYDKYQRIDIYSLKSLMGHENIETTERYLHLAMDIIASREHISHLDKIMDNKKSST